MARPNLEEIIQYLTTSEAAQELDLARTQFKNRLTRNIFPPPTFTNAHGVRLFDEDWLKRAKLIMACERRVLGPFELKRALSRLDLDQEVEGFLEKYEEEAHPEEEALWNQSD